MPPMAPILTVQDARKRFGATPALQGVSLELQTGQLLGLLGPNGAGKTTLVRAIAGRVRLDGGRVTFNDRELLPGQTAEGLGLVPQEIALYPLLTARENLEAFGSFHGLRGPRLRQRVDWALEWTGLTDRAREPVNRFSGGMRRRVNIACGVLHEPSVVLLDEPTVGVDPQSRERIYEMLEQLTAGGAALLLTTHHLEEAEARCPRLVIIDHGRIVAAGSAESLVRDAFGGGRRVVLRLDRRPAADLPEYRLVEGRHELEAPLTEAGRDLTRLIESVEAAGSRVVDLHVESPNLQSVFIHLTGRELRE